MTTARGARRAGKYLKPWRTADSLRPSPFKVIVPLTPMTDLELMIENGWGDTPQLQLPEDWRTRKREK